MRLSVLVATLAFSLVGLSIADESHASIKKPTHIPPQPLGSALQSLAKDRGFQVVYESAEINPLRTQGAVGELTSEEALTQLLSGTGFTYKFYDDNAVSILPVNAKTPPQARADSASSEAPGADNTKGVKKDSSNSFRLAQTPQGAPAGDSSVEKQKENEPASLKKPVVLDEVVVTGTHITGSTPPSPTIVLGQDYINRSGYNTLGDVLRSLPQNYPGEMSPTATSVVPPTASIGNSTGASAPNLRGLGPNSTLTLLDGHRFAADSAAGTADLSSIPLAAIDRIEVVPDGASTIYGSDAVAGVVNIILKKSYDGAQVTGSVGEPTEGGGLLHREGALLGKSWSGGGALVTFEHAHQNYLYSDQRDFSSTAPMPFTLLPQYSSSSYVAYAHQDITDSLSAFVEGNYFSKSNSYITAYSTVPYIGYWDAPSTQYAITGGLDWKFSQDWSANLVVSGAKQINPASYYYHVETTDSNLPTTDLSFDAHTKSVELGTTGSVVDLGTGPIRAALGAGDRWEGYDNRVEAEPSSLRNDSRSIRYAYAEVAIPLLAPSDVLWRHVLELNISGRYEHYSDFGGESVPKLGLVYSPLRDLTLRASWGRSYRAPTLANLYSTQRLLVETMVDSAAPSGTSTDLIITGANPSLQPETATDFTGGIDFQTDLEAGRIKASATYFNTRYSNRISTLPNQIALLAYPGNAPFITRNPSAAQVNGLIGAIGALTNLTGLPIDPAGLGAIVDDRKQNIESQRISGTDASVDYIVPVSRVQFDAFLNASYLHIVQTASAGATEQVVTNDAYNPPHLRSRGGVTATIGGLSVTAIANYVSSSTNIYYPGNLRVASWTTLDGQLAYTCGFRPALRELRVTASVQNLLDRSPPYVVYNYSTTGVNYDPTNASPIGRFITLGASLSW